MKEIIELYLENNDALENVKGSSGRYTIPKRFSALTPTIKDEKIDVERVNLALKLIKDNTHWNSYFRGDNRFTVAIAVSFEEDMEESLKEIISIHDRLKKELYNTGYLIAAALVIFNSRERLNVDMAIKNTKVAYDYMKKNHKFITGSEDIASAAAIATTTVNFEQTFNEIEECYEILKKEKIGSSNDIQALSHILSLVNLPQKEKCEKVIEMKSIVKENKVAFDGCYLPLLGIISFLVENKQEFINEIVDVSNELKKHKGFSNFALGKSSRNMIAMVLVSMKYIENLDGDLKNSIINNTNNATMTVITVINTAIASAITGAIVAGIAASSSSY